MHYLKLAGTKLFFEMQQLLSLPLIFVLIMVMLSADVLSKKVIKLATNSCYDREYGVLL